MAGLTERPDNHSPPDQLQGSPELSLAYLTERKQADSKSHRIPELMGQPSATAAGGELERDALYHALQHSPTPRNLGASGCMAALDEYVLQPYFRRHQIDAPQFNSTDAFLKWFQHSNSGQIQKMSIHDLKVTDLEPGDIIIPKKVDGSQHAMVVTRVPAYWQYPREALMFVGNTGRPMLDGPAYPHFRAAQEVIGANTDVYNEHHGQINSRRNTNPYLDGHVFIVRFASD